MGVAGEVGAPERRRRVGMDPTAEIRAARFELLEGLSAGMVHEARNPLNAMAIHLEVLADKLRDEVLGEVPPHLQKNLQAARNQIRRLDQILRRYGDFASGQPSESQPALSTLWDQAAGLCEYQVRRAGVRLEVELPGSCRPVGDATLLCQTLIEFLLFSLASCPDGGLKLRGTWDGDSTLSIEFLGDGSAGPSHGIGLEPGPRGQILRSLVGVLGGEVEVGSSGGPFSCRLKLPARQE